MPNLNKVMLIGRLGQDPEKRTIPSGKSVVKVSLATNEYFVDKSGEKKEKTEWHRMVFWDKLADLVAQYCHKGSLIYAEGSLRSNEWQDKEGIKRNTTEINVISFQFLDPRGSKTMESGDSSYRKSSDNAEPPANDPDYLEDDIPF